MPLKSLKLEIIYGLDMLKSYKFRLYPNKIQQQFINKTIGCCRFIYNQMLAEKQENYEIQKQIEVIENMYNSPHKKLEFKLTTEKEYKKEFEFLKEVDSITLVQSRRDLEQAYQNFFRKIKLKQQTNLKFKSKKNSKNSYRTQYINDNIRIQDNKIRL